VTTAVFERALIGGGVDRADLVLYSTPPSAVVFFEGGRRGAPDAHVRFRVLTEFASTHR
jgi:hypothetical protein